MSATEHARRVGFLEALEDKLARGAFSADELREAEAVLLHGVPGSAQQSLELRRASIRARRGTVPIPATEEGAA